MKHEYLIELLKQNKTVIVPNLGAFSNNDNPHHPFLFNEYLKFNDGMMAKHISSKEGINIDAAGETIEKFTNELKDILGAGKEVVIPGIGTLLKKDGKTILNSPFASVTPEKKEAPATKTIDKEIPKAEIPKAEVPEIEIPKTEAPKAEIPKIEIPKSETPKVEVPKIEVPKAEIPNKDTPKIEIPKSDVPKIEIPKTEIPKTEPQKIETPKSVVPEKKEESPKKENLKQVQVKEKKKSKKLVWIIILVLILGGGGTAGYLFKEEIMTMIGMNEKTAGTDEKKKTDSEKSENKNESSENVKEEIPVTEETQDSVAAESETIVEPPVEENKTKEAQVKEDPAEQPKEEIKVVAENPSAPGNYYIIVGCFQEQAHADNMISKISSAGLTPTNVGTFNGLQHIAAGSASDLETALQQATSIRGSFPKLWILKR